MIKLEYFKKPDFQQLIKWVDSEELLLQWGGPDFEYPLDETQLTEYIKYANTEISDVLVYKVILIKTEEIIGHISLNRIDKKNQFARVGKILIGEPNVRGQGVGQKMLEEVLKIAFGELKMHRVSLGVFDFNQSAVSCYEKVGFIKEGLLRDSRKIGNEYWSLIEMSILESEWFENHSFKSEEFMEDY